ncbi:uncharacterized protein V1513DRAFT_414012 [Lipomyces chichibuensis]|uniref:uncharacterized protein n=1 Tax=Lipomyces chichibuensis TaxID=1546026 RepID=UPI003343543D
MGIFSMFKTGVFPICARVAPPSSLLAKSTSSRFGQNATRIFGRQQSATKARLYQTNSSINWRRGVLYSSVSAITLFATSGSSTIRCDATGGRKHYSDSSATVAQEILSDEPRKLGGLDYRELAIGSFTGLFVGLLIGKFSRVLAFLAGSTYLFLQFLASRRVITLPYNRFYTWAKKRYGNKELILENLSFKVAFGAAMVVAAASA